MGQLKVKIELVTNTNRNLFEQLESGSHQEKNCLWFQNHGWYSPNEVKHSWNAEIYILVTDTKTPRPIGFFKISKDHQDGRAEINGFYIIPKERGNKLHAMMILFIGNRVFGELGYTKIHASAWEANENVVKLYDSIMEREGVQKKHFYYNRQYHNKILWAVHYETSIWNGKTELQLKDVQERLKQ